MTTKAKLLIVVAVLVAGGIGFFAGYEYERERVVNALTSGLTHISKEVETPTESATEAYSHTPAGEASDQKHAEENAQAETTTPKAEAQSCRESNNPSERCQALGQLELSERPDHGASAGSYTDEEGYTYEDNSTETVCSNSPKSALPSCK